MEWGKLDGAGVLRQKAQLEAQMKLAREAEAWMGLKRIRQLVEWGDWVFLWKHFNGPSEWIVADAALPESMELAKALRAGDLRDLKSRLADRLGPKASKIAGKPASWQMSAVEGMVYAQRADDPEFCAWAARAMEEGMGEHIRAFLSGVARRGGKPLDWGENVVRLSFGSFWEDLGELRHSQIDLASARSLWEKSVLDAQAQGGAQPAPRKAGI